ncbi:uncharacterized protein LOC117582123 isoform X1 [Drosophila guanche]|uniref:Uncharacterized protein n=1 Tax=Drosophila guanche TaxID=7266 RepID=A0A3B0J6E8_DROGU|nr:uncharacterized protein LOC117582123 isoform X1 [Drosophila guanche]SPP75563.1 Hypothetical predicted protein [Drosophila guanche]
MYFRGSSFAATAIWLFVLVLEQQHSDVAVSAASTNGTKAINSSVPSVPAAIPEALKPDDRKTVKKALSIEAVPNQKVADVVIAEKPELTLKEQSKESPQAAAPESPSSGLPVEDVRIEHSSMGNDVDFPGQAVVYVLVAITSSAILLLVLRVYRMRLTRAERKYGVQGDRANQELTPLPMAIEDVNSDEEDHTVFEVNRQNIRIL